MQVDRKITRPLGIFLLATLVATLGAAAQFGVKKGAPAPGSFLGADLITEDAEAASRFYAELFPWDVEKVENGGYAVHHKGRLVASISQIEDTDDEVDKSFWLVAFAVNGLKQALRLATQNDATVLEGNTKVKDFGRYAVIRDTEGAPIMFIQSGEIPIGGTEGPGAWVWAELWTNDIDQAASFYSSVVGLGRHTTDRGGQPYHYFMSQGKPRAGIIKIPAELERVKPGWAPYVAVEDLKATVAKAEELGGRIVFAETEHPSSGSVALILDPTGAALFLYEIGSAKETSQ